MTASQQEAKDTIDSMIVIMEEVTKDSRMAKLVAKQSMMLYTAHKAEGFTEEEALQLTIAALKTAK